jgi:hypothetical protein
VSKASDLADELVGTARMCVVEEELDTSDQVDEFDMLAFVCQGCGWWCSTDELNNIGPRDLCDECHAACDDCECEDCEERRAEAD